MPERAKDAPMGIFRHFQVRLSSRHLWDAMPRSSTHAQRRGNSARTVDDTLRGSSCGGPHGAAGGGGIIRRLACLFSAMPSATEYGELTIRPMARGDAAAVAEMARELAAV